jgi:hypothetical protein
MQLDLSLLVARQTLGLLTADDLVRWALVSLEQGLDSESLRRLAGLNSEAYLRMADAEPLFRAAIHELRVPVPEQTAATRTYVARLAREIVEGTAPPRAQVARIHREIVSPLNHPKDLMVWCYVNDGLRPSSWSLDADDMVHFEPIPDAELDDAIRALAEWYLTATRP